MEPARWPRASTIRTPRLVLEPLRIEHAQEMVSLLDDPSLYEFTGGAPSTLEQLLDTYARQAVGHSPDDAQGWLNWIVRHAVAGAVMGTVQATLHDSDGPMTADLAWVIGSAFQRRGYAKEAATAMLAWLGEQDVRRVRAHIHPGHAGSIAVARHLGLRSSERWTGGEVVWVSED